MHHSFGEGMGRFVLSWLRKSGLGFSGAHSYFSLVFALLCLFRFSSLCLKCAFAPGPFAFGYFVLLF